MELEKTKCRNKGGDCNYPKLNGTGEYYGGPQILAKRKGGRQPPPTPSSVIVFKPSTFILGPFGSTFTFVNKCEYTVWPSILANAGSPRLGSTGFELPPDSSRSFQVPTGWSGRFWARTACSFDDSGFGSYLTGDCGSGQVECNRLGDAPAATLAEFTLWWGGQDFYDVSLVDGYNLPMIVEGSGGSGMCASTGCSTDLNSRCPEELRVGEGSAYEAFGSPKYCCSVAFNTPATCKPSVYSEMFKSTCPRSYSYAYDDATSTFTCIKDIINIKIGHYLLA